MEDKELFLEHYNLKKEYREAKIQYEKALDKKSEYLYSILPKSARLDQEIYHGSSNDRFLNYTIKLTEIDKEVEVRRNLMDNLLYRLKLKTHELRDSKETLDRIYIYRYVDKVKVNKFCRLVGYSREQTYRKIREIDKILKDDTK